MTPTSVGLVLVEGQDADGATMDRDSLAFAEGDLECSEQATAAVLRTEAIAATRGLRLHSIGVTWSEDADFQASKLMESLSDSGFDNVVAIRMPEATEALARGVAEVLGFATTAVCVIESESAISLIVNTNDGGVQTAFNHAIHSDDDLISWLSTVFTRADWAPEALVVVGSAGDLDPILHDLEDALSVPVYAPEEAKLALARGAALASAYTTEMPRVALDDGFVVEARPAQSGPSRNARRHSLATVGPVAMLAVGAITFVVSVSIAVSLQLTPTRTAPSDPVPAARVETPEAVRPAPSAVPPPVAVEPAPIVEAAPPPAPEAPAPVDEVPAAIVDTPVETPYVDQAPAAEPEAPPAAPVIDDPALAPPMVGTPLPADAAPPYVAPAPTKKPGILTRIKEKLTPGPG